MFFKSIRPPPTNKSSVTDISPVTVKVPPSNVRFASPFTVLASTDVITLLFVLLVYEEIAAELKPVILEPSPIR